MMLYKAKSFKAQSEPLFLVNKDYNVDCKAMHVGMEWALFSEWFLNTVQMF